MNEWKKERKIEKKNEILAKTQTTHKQQHISQALTNAEGRNINSSTNTQMINIYARWLKLSHQADKTTRDDDKTSKHNTKY